MLGGRRPGLPPGRRIAGSRGRPAPGALPRGRAGFRRRGHVARGQAGLGPARGPQPRKAAAGVMASPYGDLVLIANPRSGRGRVGEELPELERQLLARRLGHRIVATEGPGHASAIAAEALRDGTRFLVAVGGDGTVQEVVNGMIEDDRPVAPDAVLGVVAAGSGSDFVRTFGLPGDAIRAVRHLTGDLLYPIDVIRIDYRDPDGPA